MVALAETAGFQGWAAMILTALSARLRGRRTEVSALVGPPRFLFLQVNKRCNLRCVHCTFWKDNDDDKANYLDQAGKRRLIQEFAAMNPRGAVVICGGESMLDLDDYFALCRDTRAAGLTAISVVNGTRIRSPKMAERMILEGPVRTSDSQAAYCRSVSWQGTQSRKRPVLMMERKP